MIYITFKCDLAKASEIKDFFKASEIIDEKKPYEYFLTTYQGVQIHAFKNKKEIYTICFNGENESKVKEVTEMFSSSYTIKSTDASNHEKQQWEDVNCQIGSDEVGKGDFFGPLVVVASYIDSDDIDYLKKLKIDDSKRMNDEYILEIGEKLLQNIKSYVVLISSEKLSLLNENNINIDKVLALSHNLAHRGLIKKYKLSSSTIVYIDQFVSENNYRKYLQDDVIENPLYFKTKGESYYPSVAVSSVLARYTFLKEWERMEKLFGVTIPKGASSIVDKVYGQLKNKYGKDIVNKYVKRFFSNYKSSL